ncbi:MAG: radical SAM family heme chaperone HemW [Firmicutes bacterium]|nr:radical SAM family heme chaperone HemW [Bacillota bacterium]
MKGLYVHIPFCLKKCAYCDFNSSSAPKSIQEKYIDALISEMAEYKGTEFDTVYIGGGTPTSLKTELLKKVILAIKDNFRICEDAEFTVEMNPKTADIKKLKMMLDLGVNRLSIGVQSFCDEELSALGRVHNAQDAKEAIALAKLAGFSNISIDLMSAVPHQTKESFARTLDTAISQNPTHISCYSLILEEGTPLFDAVRSGKTVLCDEDTEREIYEYAVDALEKNGYKQYEISNFAKDGKVSHHNLKYWNLEEYLGIGLSAHSFVGGIRFSNTDDIKEYMLYNFRSGKKEILSREDMMSEFMFLGLRKTEGVSKQAFFENFGAEIADIFQKPLEKFLKTGFLIDENGKIRLSRKAVSVSNQIMCEFLL